MNKPDSNEEKRPQRKPYVPPRILSREPLEAMAALCTPRPPATGNVGLCPRGSINS